MHTYIYRYEFIRKYIYIYKQYTFIIAASEFYKISINKINIPHTYFNFLYLKLKSKPSKVTIALAKRAKYGGMEKGMSFNTVKAS